MRKIIIAALFSAITLMAMPNNELELLMTAKAAEKKAVVLATMHLNGEKKEKFGKLYDEYQQKLFKLKIENFELIGEYAKNYNNLTNEKADKLIKKWLKEREAQIELDKKYIKKFRKILDSSEVIRYFQIEHRLGLLEEVEKSSVIPLAQPTAK